MKQNRYILKIRVYFPRNHDILQIYMHILLLLPISKYTSEPLSLVSRTYQKEKSHRWLVPQVNSTFNSRKDSAHEQGSEIDL